MTGPPIVPEILCQQALERVLTYLADDGVILSAATCRQALNLVESAIAEKMDLSLPARCVAAIPDHFELPEASIPEAHPALKRGFIGYE